MKKISVLILAFLLVCSLAACGRRNNEDNTTPSTVAPATTLPLMPELDPTLDTNIPDPDINTEMPTFTDGTDPSDAAGDMGGAENGNG